jgi:hypothetical protein
LLAEIKEKLLTWSIESALKEQVLWKLSHKLRKIVPDIVHQYTSFNIDSKYLELNVRAVHAFQMMLVETALRTLPGNLTIIDIGDSAGTHIQYVKGLHPEQNIKSLSINVDQEAVNRIRAKGLDALCARAEDLSLLDIEVDVFLLLETLEHLTDPIRFLKDLSCVPCKSLVITVPYVAKSRVGLHHIRHNQKRHVNMENTHIFELAPADWRLIFQHSGWAIVRESIYWQYPRWYPLRLVQEYWKRYDFEGFYGVILKPDKTWSSVYEWY